MDQPPRLTKPKPRPTTNPFSPELEIPAELVPVVRDFVEAYLYLASRGRAGHVLARADACPGKPVRGQTSVHTEGWPPDHTP